MLAMRRIAATIGHDNLCCVAVWESIDTRDLSHTICYGHIGNISKLAFVTRCQVISFCRGVCVDRLVLHRHYKGNKFCSRYSEWRRCRVYPPPPVMQETPRIALERFSQ